MDTETLPNWLQEASDALSTSLREIVKQLALSVKRFKAFLRVLANSPARRKLRRARQRTKRGQNAQRRANLKLLR